MRRNTGRREGVVATESAIVYPVLFLLLFGLIVGGVGVFRYQQVALLAREAARATSVRGSDRQRETGEVSPTAEEIRQRFVLRLAPGLEPEQVSVRVELVNGVTGAAEDWDQSRKSPTSLTAGMEPVANRVRITLVYRWQPGVFLRSPVNLKSVCEIPMAF